MNRVEIYNLIENIIPTHSVGQVTGPITKDCCILRRNMNTPSMSNSESYWDNWTIDIYSPKSPIQLDTYVQQLFEVLRANGCEVQNLIDGDYYDEVMKSFSTSLTFRIPKTYKYN